MREFWIIVAIFAIYAGCLLFGAIFGKKQKRSPAYIDDTERLSMEMRRMRTLDYWNNPVVRQMRIGRDETKFD